MEVRDEHAHARARLPPSPPARLPPPPTVPADRMPRPTRVAAASVAVKSSLGGADPIFRKMLDPAAYKLDEQDANPAAGGRAHTIPTSGVVSLNI